MILNFILQSADMSLIWKDSFILKHGPYSMLTVVIRQSYESAWCYWLTLIPSLRDSQYSQG